MFCTQTLLTWGWAWCWPNLPPEGNAPLFILARNCPPWSVNTKYAVIEREVLAIRWAIDQLKYYLWECCFNVVMDHAPLQWLARMKDTNPHLMQWYLALQPYKFEVQYRRDQDHANTGFFFLSRPA